MKPNLITVAGIWLCVLASARAVEPANALARKFEFTSAAPAPRVLTVPLPEGNYAVTVSFGDASGATTNTVKAEARRLMLENVTTAPGKSVTRRFAVNIRKPDYPGGHVKLKTRETTDETATWDEKLSLEFLGQPRGVQSVEIAPAPDVTTIFIAGDSTVCDQPRAPWNSWGQMLPRFFGDRVAVANHAQSGESIKSSLGAHRFDKIFSSLRPGDYLFVQFGHNDQKDKSTNALALYKSNLKKIVATTRAKGATPVLVTSMERKAGVKGNTLGNYPDTVRAVAGEDGVALIDLNAMSVKLYQALGPKLDRAFQDGTHHNNYGSYELARCVAGGIRQARLPGLAENLAGDANAFDPSKPDDADSFNIPEGSLRDETKPDGN
ncbi:MAG: rhamnogalacturonan acetylesterase [Verrucomicrobia bacterium]|nr:rhamnogalacturonan acetylesterase [Verrucomicrobiota bacterium]